MTNGRSIDHLNAPLLVTDANKNIVWKASYNPFGRASIELEQIKLNLRAYGQYADEETRLYYNWNRYYNPELGRYITSDPLGLQAGVNTYIYVNGNPINYTDPTGLFVPALIPVAQAAFAGFAFGSAVEATSELANNGGAFDQLNSKSIAISGAAGALTGGVGGYAISAGMSAYRALVLNTVIGGVAGGTQQLATNSCSGDALDSGVLFNAALGAGLNGLGSGLYYGSKSSVAAVTKTNLKNFNLMNHNDRDVVSKLWGNTVGANIGTGLSTVVPNGIDILVNTKNNQ